MVLLIVRVIISITTLTVTIAITSVMVTTGMCYSNWPCQSEHYCCR
jgi:hypothetical protein